jgi:apolipoprotein N-acyltransferase
MSSSPQRWQVWQPWMLAALSACLLELPFPLAGPLPPLRSVFAWFGLVPLLYAILAEPAAPARRPLRRGFLLGYLCGFLWYTGNCYWVRDTMAMYGGMPAIFPVLLLIGFSLVLGLYVGIFGLCIALIRQSGWQRSGIRRPATGSFDASPRLALAASPFLWVALELAASRITSVPWDQLGYSQVDNALVNQLAPWTGVYGISFLLVAVNALIAGAFVIDRCPPRTFLESHRPWGIAGVLLMVGGCIGIAVAPPNPTPTATAVLIQPNLDVSADNRWLAPGEWDQHIAEFGRLAASAAPTHPDLVAWPESPAPFDETDPRFRQALVRIARSVEAPLIVGNIGWSPDSSEAPPASGSPADNASPEDWNYFNSALVIGSDGARVGRYDKIHLVPFGEYIPYADLLTFARKLTGRVSKFTRGSGAKVFLLPAEAGPGSAGQAALGNAHRYGVFICYESVFADEVRQFARLGAQVLVNISDDGWYGDTSAPFQHFNMARMRAIENRRWILRDTNTGITAVIDPYGRVRQSIPRHQLGELTARYGFRSDVTFYTAHGDVFAWLCALGSLGMVGWTGSNSLREKRLG